MFLHIRQLQLGRIRFNESYEPGTIDFFDPQLRQSTPIKASGTADLSQALMEIRVRGHLSARMEFACDRCLEPSPFPIDTDFDLVYRSTAYSPEKEEVNVEDAESEVGFYEGDGLDLSDVIREQVLLSLPMHRICRENCKGICAICGQNRNITACECHLAAKDDRWAGLKDLK